MVVRRKKVGTDDRNAKLRKGIGEETNRRPAVSRLRVYIGARRTKRVEPASRKVLDSAHVAPPLINPARMHRTTVEMLADDYGKRNSQGKYVFKSTALPNELSRRGRNYTAI